MACWHCVHGLKVMIVADHVLVLNFTVSWIVDGKDRSWKSVGHPRNMSSSAGRCTTESSTTLLVVSFLSWLTKVSGRFTVPSDHN